VGWLVAEPVTKDSLFAAIQQRLSGMSNIINLRAARLQPVTVSRGRVVSSIAFDTGCVPDRSLTLKPYNTERRSRRTGRGGNPASNAAGRAGAVRKTPSILLAALPWIASVVNVSTPSVRTSLVCGYHFSFAAVMTCTYLPFFNMYLLLAQIDNNNNNINANFGYVHHMNNSSCTYTVCFYFVCTCSVCMYSVYNHTAPTFSDKQQ
jgi:hypothetical protein